MSLFKAKKLNHVILNFIIILNWKMFLKNMQSRIVPFLHKLEIWTKCAAWEASILSPSSCPSFTQLQLK